MSGLLLPSSVLVVVCLMSASCTPRDADLPPDGPPESGRIVGHLLISGGIFDVKKPVAGTVTVTVGANEAGTTTGTDAQADGSFEVSVLPGEYTVTGRTPSYVVDGQQALCRAKHKVTVASGETATANVYCEIK